MRCPICSTDRAKTVVTNPSDHHKEGRVVRTKKCRNCNKQWNTIEVNAREFTQMKKAISLKDRVGAETGEPLPTLPEVKMLDIETELEELLAPALQTVRKSLDVQQQSQNLPRQSLDTARWLIEDRREYRKKLVERGGASTKSDPKLVELANVLQMLPDPEPEEETGS